VDRVLEEQVWFRARSRCEYCQLPFEFAELRFQVDHIIPRKHHGPTDKSNLALACFYCNSYKGPNLSGIAPVSNRVERLFDPRTDQWNEHFEWAGPYLVGLTPKGRATTDTLNINEPRAVNLRRYLMDAGVFPP
jgi:hypothetical protein